MQHRWTKRPFTPPCGLQLPITAHNHLDLRQTVEVSQPRGGFIAIEIAMDQHEH